jgi:CheY-like chemotaxis protein
MHRTILLADDSATIRRVVELTFSDSDIRVEAVGSGSEALERLAVLQPDLVLADVVMPGPTGYELCRAIKDSDHPVPVLLLAGTFEPFDAALAEDCGADGHVVKPFESQALLDRVASLLERPVPEPAAPPPSTPLEPARSEATPQETEDATGAFEATTEDAAEPEAAETEVEIPVHHADEPEVRTVALELSAAQMEAIVEAVVERLSDRVVREIAWEVVPDLAEALVRERLRQLEDEAAG